MNGAPPPAPQHPPGTTTVAIAQQQQQAGFTSPAGPIFSSQTVVQQAEVATPGPAAAVIATEAPSPMSNAPAPTL
jgi:hypothetical protein